MTAAQVVAHLVCEGECTPQARVLSKSVSLRILTLLKAEMTVKAFLLTNLVSPTKAIPQLVGDVSDTIRKAKSAVPLVRLLAERIELKKPPYDQSSMLNLRR